MSDKPEAQVGPVMVFTPQRDSVVRFFTDVLGLHGDAAGDATWIDAGNVKLVVHDPDDRQTPQEITRHGGFVVWFGVADVRGAFDRARQASVAASEFFGDYFFARDPDGRFVGIYALEDGHGHNHEH